MNEYLFVLKPAPRSLNVTCSHERRLKAIFSLLRYWHGKKKVHKMQFIAIFESNPVSQRIEKLRPVAVWESRGGYSDCPSLLCL